MAFRFEIDPLTKLPHCQNFAFSPDGKHVVGLPRASTAKLFDTKTWAKKLEFKKSSDLGAVAFSPDGKIVALAEMYCYLGTYNVKTGEPICKWRISKEFNEVSGVIMSPSTPEVIYSCWHNRVSIFDVKTGKLTRELPVADVRASVQSISLSPDGNELAAAVNIHGDKGESVVVIWSWPGGRELRRLPMAGNSPKHKSFKLQDLCHVANGRFAAASDTGIVAIFDAKSGKVQHKLRDAAKRSYAKFAVAPNGTYLACVVEGQLFVWNLATKKLLAELRVDATSSHCVGFSPDADLLAVGVNQVLVWRTDDLFAT